jgi:hypothetical protein
VYRKWLITDQQSKLGWFVYLYVVSNGPSGATFDPDRKCGVLGFSCGIATNLLASGVLVAFASTFILGRVFGLQGAKEWCHMWRAARVLASQDPRSSSYLCTADRPSTGHGT